MSKILIAYATSEGQTAKISTTLAQQLETLGHGVELVDLGAGDTGPDVKGCDAIIVAASVHAGKHQDSVVEFVAKHAAELRRKTTAFLSVSIAAATTGQTGGQRADEQIALFLRDVDWKPDIVEKLGGAFRYSGFPAVKRWVFALSQRLFRKQLGREGWPDLTIDQEFTDGDAVRRFGSVFAARL